METSGVWEPLGPSECCGLEDDLLLSEAFALIGDLDDEWLETPHEPSAPSPRAPTPGGPTDYTANAVIPQLTKWPRLKNISVDAVKTCPKARRRAEVLHLRDVVADLDRQLASLRRDVDRQYIHRSLGQRAGSNEVATQLWKNVAVHQQTQRLEAEKENAALKSLLREQIQVGKRLERLLHRSSTHAEAPGSSDSDVKRLERGKRICTSSRSKAFDELRTRCDALYADTDSVLSRFVRAGVPRSVDLVHGVDGVRMHTTEQCVLPFHYEKTANVLWVLPPQVSPTPRMHRREDHNEDGDTADMHFTMLLEAGESRGEISVTLVKRRYVEAHRVVIVFSGFLEPLEINATTTEGIRVRIEGWQITEPLESNPSGGSKLTEYYTSAPLVVDATSEDHARNVPTLMAFLSKAMAVELESHILNLENQLIERSLRGSWLTTRVLE